MSFLLSPSSIAMGRVHTAVMAEPQEEPVSIAEMKTHLKIDTSHEDIWLTDAIAAARHTLEAASGVALIHRTLRFTLNQIEADVFLPYVPAAQLLACRIVHVEGPATELDVEDLRLEAAQGILSFPKNRIALYGHAEFQVEYKAGFAEEASGVPQSLKIALMQHVAALYARRYEKEDTAPALQAALSVFRLYGRAALEKRVG